MKILAFDTATEACSVALLNDDKISECYEEIPRGHAQHILAMCQHVLDEQNCQAQDIDTIAYGAGPGSFTGLRIASSVAQGFAVALNLPVIAISSLQALAQAAYEQTQNASVLAAIDARMEEVYFSYYEFNTDKQCMQEVIVDQLCAPELAPLPDSEAKQYCAAGSGWHIATLQQRFRNCISQTIPDCYPRASSMLKIAEQKYTDGDYLTVDKIHSMYLRDKVTT